MSNASRRAKDSGREFNITKSDIQTLNLIQGGKCALTGWVLDWEPAYNGKRDCPPTRASIDRIDSSKGYTLDNIQLVCDMANRLKSAYSQEEFIAMCKAIAEKHSLSENS